MSKDTKPTRSYPNRLIKMKYDVQPSRIQGPTQTKNRQGVYKKRHRVRFHHRRWMGSARE